MSCLKANEEDAVIDTSYRKNLSMLVQAKKGLLRIVFGGTTSINSKGRISVEGGEWITFDSILNDEGVAG